jgi:hypothetical protein
MKKIINTILFLLTFIIFAKADYIITGTGPSKGEAYISAMSKAPSGNHWIFKNINYSRWYRGYTCTITWKQQ